MSTDFVAIASSDFHFHDVTRLYEIVQNCVNATLRNACRRGDIAQATVGVLGDGQQDVAVSGQQRPVSLVEFFWYFVTGYKYQL